MKYQANSVLNKFKAAENTGNGLLHVAPKQGPSVSPSLMKRQQSSDEVRKAFEAELMAGKQRLKKLGGDSKKTNGIDILFQDIDRYELKVIILVIFLMSRYNSTFHNCRRK